jgi:hypothetical protein
MGHHGRFTVAFFLVLLAIAGSALCSAAEPERVQEFGDSIDVRVVNVEAVITDGRGERVRGLTAADFRLLVDGREVPVEYFTEIEEGKAAAAPTVGSPKGASGPQVYAPRAASGVREKVAAKR